MTLEEHLVHHGQLTISGVIGHDRGHEMDSVADHTLPHSGLWGSFVRSNPTTGTWELTPLEDSLPTPLYGDGSDGDVRLTANTTLARDMFYRNLVVDPGKTVTVSGWRIFVSDTCLVQGTIQSNGVAGGNAAGLTPGVAGEATISNTVGNGTAGSRGGSFSAIAPAPSAVTGEGGKGGNGGTSFGEGHEVAPDVVTARFRMISPHLMRTPSTFYHGGGGGCGGSGTTGYYASSAGGGGGGGWVYVLFDDIINNGTIRALAGSVGTGGGGSFYPGLDGEAGTDGKVTLINRLTGIFS